MKNLRETMAGAVFAVAMSGAAYFTGMRVFGAWSSGQVGVIGLSMPEPDWAEWSFEATRTRTDTADPLLSWLLVVASSAIIWHASILKKGTHRWTWLWAMLAGVIAVIACGDIAAAISILAGVVFTALICRTGIKPVGVSVAACIATGFAVDALWGMTFAEECGRAKAWPWQVAGMLISAGVIAHLFHRFAPKNLPARGMTSCALVAGLIYAGPLSDSYPAAWRARYASVARLFESGEQKALRAELSAYRLSESEASDQRFPDAEASTRWNRHEHLASLADKAGEPAVVAALHARALFNPKLAGQSVSNRLTEARTFLSRPPASDSASRAVYSLMLARVAEKSGDSRKAADSYRDSLQADPADAQTWYAYALALAASRDSERAAKALAIAALGDPRLLLSPALEREPLVGSVPEALRYFEKWNPEIGSDDEASVCRNSFLKWHYARRDSGKRMDAFLNRIEGDPAVPESICLVRKRTRELLDNPSPVRSGALLSAATAMLCDRHLDMGHCALLFESFSPTPAGEVYTRPPRSLAVDAGPGWRLSARYPGMDGVAIIRRYPEIHAWQKVSSITEGGIGTHRIPLEENLLVRIVTYGQMDPRCPLPEDWLKTHLKEFAH